MSSPLCALPTEVLVQVTSHLTTPELSHVRLSCRRIEQALFHFFAKEFFSVRQIMFSDISIRALVAISEHSQLAPYVKKIIVGLDTIVDASSVGRTPSGVGTHCRQMFRKFKSHDQWLKDSGEDRLLLISALQKLTNCQNIEIRDFHGKGLRPRDATPWKSWGSGTIVTSSRFSAVIPCGYDPTRALTVMLRAVADAGTKIESFEMITRTSFAHSDSPFYIPGSLRPHYSHAFRYLKVLMLCIKEHSFAQYGTSHGFESLGSFLCFTPNLRHLRLNSNCAYLGPLGSPGTAGTVRKYADLLEMLIMAFAQNSLERLELGTLVLPEPETSALLQTLSSLEHLTLRNVYLSTTGSEYSLFESLKSLPCLKSLKIEHLKLDADPILFKTTPETALKYTCLRNRSKKAQYVVVAYEGPDMHDHLSNLQQRVVVLTKEVLEDLQREELENLANSSEAELDYDEEDDYSELGDDGEEGYSEFGDDGEEGYSELGDE